jgi:hypothetical protein
LSVSAEAGLNKSMNSPFWRIASTPPRQSMNCELSDPPIGDQIVVTAGITSAE